MTLLGTTGCGKTTLAQAVLPQRDYVLVFATKPKDPLIDQFKQQGYDIFREWTVFDPEEHPRVVLWPRAQRRADIREVRQLQREVFQRALNDVFHQGGWCIYIDEGEYLASDLGLEPEMKMIWQQGRAINLSLVVSTQRPRFIPLAAYGQATHLYVWGSRDEYDLKRLTGVSGMVDKKGVQAQLQALPSKHHCLYISQDGKLEMTRVE